MPNNTVDVLIIGAGPAGTVAASKLHQLGKNVRVVEKQTFPRFVIGESLLPVTMEHLESAGLWDAVNAAGFQKKLGARFIKGDKFCEFDFSEQFGDGWKWTWQMPRADFDKALADEAMRQGVSISFNTTVKDVRLAENRSVLTVEDEFGEQQINARYVIDCSGYGRVLPRLLQLDQPSELPPRSAFFAHASDGKRQNIPSDLQITVVVVQPDVWFWVIPFSNGTTSLGFVGDPAFFSNCAGSPEEFRAMLADVPQFAGRFADEALTHPPTVINAYSQSTRKLYGPGYVLAGNSAEFLDPIFSSGVALATGSGMRAAELVDRAFNGEQVNWETEYEQPLRSGVAIFKSFVDGWYDGSLHNIFFSDYINPEIKKQICSVLAGYVWDDTNPVVQRHDKILKLLEKVIAINGNV